MRLITCTKQQAAQKRHARQQQHASQTSRRSRIGEAISGIASDYSTTIDAVAQEAYETATDALNELAEMYGRQLVMATEAVTLGIRRGLIPI
jgi:hypothetical protein